MRFNIIQKVHIQCVDAHWYKIANSINPKLQFFILLLKDLFFIF